MPCQRQLFLEVGQKGGAPEHGGFSGPAPEPLGPGAVLPHRGDLEGPGPGGGALGVGIEQAHRFDAVAEKLQADRLFQVRREDVQDPPPEGELPRVGHGVVFQVPRFPEMFTCHFRGEFLPRHERQASAEETAGGVQADRCGPGRGDQDDGALLEQAPERPGTGGGDFGVGGESPVGVHLQFGEVDDLGRYGDEQVEAEADFLGEGLRLGAGGGDDRERALSTQRRLGEDQRLRPSRRPRDGDDARTAAEHFLQPLEGPALQCRFQCSFQRNHRPPTRNAREPFE